MLRRNIELLKKRLPQEAFIEGNEYIYIQFATEIPKYLGKYVGLEFQRITMFDYDYFHVFDNNGVKESFLSSIIKSYCIRPISSDFTYDQIIEFLNTEQIEKKSFGELSFDIHNIKDIFSFNADLTRLTHLPNSIKILNIRNFESEI